LSGVTDSRLEGRLGARQWNRRKDKVTANALPNNL